MSSSPAVLPPGGDLVGRIERRAIVLTLAGVIAAWVVPRGGGEAAAAVAGGALLAFVSFRIIKRGVDALMARAVGQTPPAGSPDGDPPVGSAGQTAATAATGPTGTPGQTGARGRGRGRGMPRGIGLFVLRYALLAGMAYVMIARLRLPPIGLLCGASVTMLAAAAEVMRRRPS